ncbi:UvrD-helicase domain-containing protein (plasmid) [Kitasatospora griseola]|uniref:UvrD-helicase domain-containing protein n=1 Tax=Kitasatospora griseola TaxID=2064 RepID=UPI003855928F
MTESEGTTGRCTAPARGGRDGEECGKPLPSRKKTGRPVLYCSQACRQAALRHRQKATAGPVLLGQAQALLHELDPLAAAETLHLMPLGEEQLAAFIRHARAVRNGLRGMYAVLGVELRPLDLQETRERLREPRAAKAPGPAAPGQEELPAALVAAIEEPAAAAAKTAGPAPKPRRAAPGRPPVAGLVPTDEQHAIIDACLGGGDLVVEAGAGTGKTSTLRMVATALGSRRGLYIAFNKVTADEAGRSFPKNIDCRTAHSLAYRATSDGMKARLNGPRVPASRSAQILRILEPLRVNADLVLTPETQARLALEALQQFCYSDDRLVGAHHVRPPKGLTDREERLLREAVLPYAQAAWKDVTSPRGQLHYAHDYYLKAWALTEPKLRADFVMLDEAQDSNPVVASLVQAQDHAQRIAVGDSNQAIYGWRGAVDALATWPARQRLQLTESWRFGPAVAAEANKWLTLLGSHMRLTGSGPATRVVNGGLDKPEALLCRTNGEAMRQAMLALAADKRPALAGGSAAIKALAEAAITLQQGKGTSHPELMAFTTWDQVRQFVTQDKSAGELRTFVRLIDSHGAEDILKACGQLVNERGADVTISTAHKAKGREWDTVRVCDDFTEPKPDEQTGITPPPRREDMMLAYVTVTRARKTLDRSGLAWVDQYTAGANGRPRRAFWDQRLAAASIAMESWSPDLDPDG